MEGCLCASLPVERVVGTEAFLKQWVNVILKNPCQVNGIFFEAVEQTDCIEKSTVVHLCAQLYRLSACIDVALPNVVKDTMRFDRVAGSEYHKHGFVNHIRSKKNDQQFQLAVHGCAIGTTGQQVEAWREEVEGTILMPNLQDFPLDVGRGHHAEVGRAKPQCQLVVLIFLIGKVVRALGKLDVILPLQDDILSWVSGGSNSEISKVQLEPDTNKLDSSRTTVRNVAILDRQKSRRIPRSCRRGNRGPFHIMPREDHEVLEVCPIARELTFPIGKTRLGCEYQIEPVSKSQDVCVLIKVSRHKGSLIMLVGHGFFGIGHLLIDLRIEQN